MFMGNYTSMSIKFCGSKQEWNPLKIMYKEYLWNHSIPLLSHLNLHKNMEGIPTPQNNYHESFLNHDTIWVFWYAYTSLYIYIFFEYWTYISTKKKLIFPFV